MLSQIPPQSSMTVDYVLGLNVFAVGRDLMIPLDTYIPQRHLSTRKVISESCLVGRLMGKGMTLILAVKLCDSPFSHSLVIEGH